MIRRASAADAPRLIEIWERSVRASHRFLDEAAIQGLLPDVRTYLTSGADLWVLAEDDVVTGFMGLTAGKIDALFLAPEATGRGGGRQFVSFARALRGDLTVDVNEQNPEAQRFYENCGFVVTGRSDTDDAGRPYPLLHMRVTEADLYQRHAGAFDAARTRSLMEVPYLERARAMAPAPARVLDLGCGAGDPIARYFIERGDAVTGVDVAPALLARARERFPAHEWIHGDMRTLDLGRHFDVIIAWDSSFHLRRDDQRRLFARVARHTAPGGVFVFTSGTTSGVSIGDLFGAPLYHASLDRAEYTALLDANGFKVVHYQADDPNCGGHTVWVCAT